MNRPGYIFRCAANTMDECCERGLFGDDESRASIILQVREGDPLFLYNYSSQLLFGTFLATCNAAKDIERWAWNGRFRYQVRVARITNDPPLPGKLLEEYLNFPTRKSQAPQPKLLPSDVAVLLELFERHPKPKSDKESSQARNPIRTIDGHFVRSMYEQALDDWFDRNHVKHGYEARLSFENYFCDFYLEHPQTGNCVYVELWGMMGDPRHRSKREKKLEIYKKNKWDLIEIFMEDLFDEKILEAKFAAFMPQAT